MASKVCLVLHRKSANELPVKEAVKYVRQQGIDLHLDLDANCIEVTGSGGAAPAVPVGEEVDRKSVV